MKITRTFPLWWYRRNDMLEQRCCCWTCGYVCDDSGAACAVVILDDFPRSCVHLPKLSTSSHTTADGHRQLWLRIPYASRLLQLFPCQQHSLSRCVRCGHDCWEHVRSAAQRRRDRPFEKVGQPPTESFVLLLHRFQR